MGILRTDYYNWFRFSFRKKTRSLVRVVSYYSPQETVCSFRCEQNIYECFLDEVLPSKSHTHFIIKCCLPWSHAKPWCLVLSLVLCLVLSLVLCLEQKFPVTNIIHPPFAVMKSLHHGWSFPLGTVWLENILHKLWKVSFLTISGRKHLANGFGETLRTHTN